LTLRTVRVRKLFQLSPKNPPLLLPYSNSLRMFRKPVKEVSPSAQLVQQLYSFGLEQHSTPPLPSSLNHEFTSPDQPEASTSTLAPPVPTSALQNLKLSPPTQKVNQSLKKLLKSTQHTVKLRGEDGKEHERELTSWKMADYAYKRDPCPFPTRARGLFTEKIGEEDYRIVARGYDKFFNVNEVSWTQVSCNHLSQSQVRGAN